MDLAERHPHKLSVRCAHLPIDPSKPHPDNQILLKLDDRSPMLRKKSYVKTEKQYTIGYELLRKYDRRSPHNHFLSEASYKTLVEYVQFPVPTPLPQNLFLCGFTNTSNGQIHSSVHGLQTSRDARFSSYASISGRTEPVPHISYHGDHCQCRQCRRHNVSNTENHGDGKFCGLNGSQWVKFILLLCALGVFFYGAYRVYCGLVTAFGWLLGWLRGCRNLLGLLVFSVVIRLLF